MRRQAKRRPSRRVGDELQKRWESIVARERRYQEGVDKLRAPRASGPRWIHTTTLAENPSSRPARGGYLEQGLCFSHRWQTKGVLGYNFIQAVLPPQ